MVFKQEKELELERERERELEQELEREREQELEQEQEREQERMNFTDQHARELRRGEWEAEQLARDYDPNYRYWKVSGPPPEISSTPEYQELCGQAIHERIERLKWAMVESALIHAKQDLRAIAERYDGERRDLLLGMAAEHDARIGAADARKAKHQVELDRLMAEMKQLEGRA